ALPPGLFGTGDLVFRSRRIRSRILATAADAAQLAAPAQPDQRGAAETWSLEIHGGAGVIERGDLSPEKEAPFR
ncbi:MAG: hypothetical protein PSX79_02310, partial [bacterium]|nr:hypothetical protein [bacterium]